MGAGMPHIVEIAASASMGMLLLAIGMATWRLLRGPDLADRVVALDMITLLMVGFIGVYAVRTGIDAVLPVAIVISLIAFLGTVAFARYLLRRKT
ncbi:MAG: monovalent cation/H+ antiporter complex subunit F [Bacteroidota bacterium]|nr:monovalent cation/H+ antiporter complex subunit F [Bacteroidota bacterium]